MELTRHFFLIFFVYFLGLCCCNDTPQNCVLQKSREYDWEYKIVTDLKKKIKNVRDDSPLDNCTNQVKVFIRFLVDKYKFNDVEEVFSISGTVFGIWEDARLKWDEKSYGNVNETQIFSSRIWAPRFQLLNGIEDDYGMYFYGGCLIESKGKVACGMRTSYSVVCGSNLKHWPYDVQNCTFKFGDSVKTTKTVFNTTAYGIMLSVPPGGTWDMVDSSSVTNSSKMEQITINLVLKRQGKVLHALIVVPLVLTSVLTIVTLFLDVRTKIRLFMICYTILLLYTALQEIADMLPKHTIDTPLILLFARGSLIITVLVLILTLILNAITKKDTILPSYVISANNFVYKGVFRHFIYPRWNNILSKEEENTEMANDDEPTSFYKEKWVDFANIINSVSVIVVIIAYLCMFAVYLPKDIIVKGQTHDIVYYHETVDS